MVTEGAYMKTMATEGGLQTMGTYKPHVTYREFYTGTSLYCLMLSGFFNPYLTKAKLSSVMSISMLHLNPCNIGLHIIFEATTFAKIFF